MNEYNLYGIRKGGRLWIAVQMESEIGVEDRSRFREEKRIIAHQKDLGLMYTSRGTSNECRKESCVLLQRRRYNIMERELRVMVSDEVVSWDTLKKLTMDFKPVSRTNQRRLKLKYPLKVEKKDSSWSLVQQLESLGSKVPWTGKVKGKKVS